MAIPVLIIGKSGSGKSASLRNFKEGEIGFINVLKKPLPFKNTFKKFESDDYKAIMNVLKVAKTNSIFIDDAGYLMTNQFMRGHSSAGSGNAIFTFYNTIGDNFWNLIQFIVNELPSEKIIYLSMHEDKNDFGDIKPKSIGKMLDEKVCIEGMFSIVIRSMFEDNKYRFKLKSDGLDVCKTPIDMFNETFIENDLKIVDKTIREYYNIENEPKKEDKKDAKNETN